MTNLEQVTEQDDEVSLFDTIDFFITHGITILMTGVLGLMVAGLYLWFTPHQYEGFVQIQMAQWSSNKNIVVNGGNVEEPGALISRLSSPSTYSLQNIQACKMESVKIDPDLALTKKLKYAIVKTSPNVIEIKVQQNSKDDVIACLESVFETIKLSQIYILESPRLQAVQLIEEKNKKLVFAKEQLLKGDQYGPALIAWYLSIRDEMARLNEDIESLTNFVNSRDSRHARLISPIYAAEKPVSPKKLISLITGLFGGLCFGIFYGLMQKGMMVLKKYRSKQLAQKAKKMI